MMAADYRHIGGVENRLGRHYSRFSPFWPAASFADQSLALRKSWNAGANRRSQARTVGNQRVAPLLRQGAAVTRWRRAAPSNPASVSTKNRRGPRSRFEPSVPVAEGAVLCLQGTAGEFPGSRTGAVSKKRCSSWGDRGFESGSL